VICNANPCLTPASLTNGQFQLAVAALAGTNSVVRVSTNLGTTNWVSVFTNAAPFTFVETNALSSRLRFYRAVYFAR
jgi:hypothetical protein